MKSTTLTITDQFCGAGGSSLGASRAIAKVGGEIKLALNHWRLAIDTHNTNFPDTLHDCTDISASDPRRYPSTTILLTSPECTNHSLAKGKKVVKAQMDLFDKGILDASAERSRATMWDVPRFAEYHKYEIIIVENVVDARKWVQFPAWLQAMHLLGYDHKSVYINSMHCHPTPQSRDRMYVVFWKKKNTAPDLDFRPRAYSPTLGRDIHAVQWWKNSQKQYGKYKSQYLYRCPETHDIVHPYYHAAFNAIDWSDRGKRIGDRSKPLSPNTMRRIRFGLQKYSNQPYLVNDQHTSGVDFRVKSVHEHLPTISTQNNYKLIMPFIIKGEHTLQDGYVRSVSETFQTQTVRQSMSLLMPVIVENKGTSTAKSSTDPLGAMTTVPYHGILTHDAMSSFLSYYYGKDQVSHITDPIGTMTTKERAFIINPSIDINDCHYRMIKPAEIKKAMAFHDSYTILGSGKDQVKQLGNAVTPPAMEWLVDRCVASLN